MKRVLEVHSLTTFWSRFRGVKGRARVKIQPLYFPRCKAVHTVGVKQSLDLVWVSQNLTVLRVDSGVSKNKIRFCARAFGVIEARSNNQASKFRVGDKLRLKGQALVETAVIMPVLFLLLFGFIEISLMLQAQQKLTHAAHWSTQVLALTNNDEKLAGALLDFYQPNTVNVAIESQSYTNAQVISASERRHKDLVKVQLSQPYALHIPFLQVEAFDLTAKASARILCQTSLAPYQCD